MFRRWMVEKKVKPLGILDWHEVDRFRINLAHSDECGIATYGHLALVTEQVGDNDLGGSIVFRDSLHGSPLKWIANGTWRDGEEFYRTLKTLFTEDPPARHAEIILVRKLVLNMLCCTAGNHDWKWMTNMLGRIQTLRLFSAQALAELVEEMRKRNAAGRRTTSYRALGLSEPAKDN